MEINEAYNESNRDGRRRIFRKEQVWGYRCDMQTTQNDTVKSSTKEEQKCLREVRI